VARKIGHLTRFPSLTLGVNVKRGQRSLSWTGSGVLIPCEERPSAVYRQLFLQGTRRRDRSPAPQAGARREHHGRGRRPGPIDAPGRRGPAIATGSIQYLTAVREVERRLTIAGEWERRPKPRPTPPRR
jgi:hypothetical protein